MDEQPETKDDATLAWDIRREGRSWTHEEFTARIDRLLGVDLEVSDGKLFGSEKTRLLILGMLLENVGLDAAVRLGALERWEEAVAKASAEGGAGPKLRDVHVYIAPGIGGSPEGVRGIQIVEDPADAPWHIRPSWLVSWTPKTGGNPIWCEVHFYGDTPKENDRGALFVDLIEPALRRFFSSATERGSR